MIHSFGRAALKVALYARRKLMGRAARSRPRKPTRWLYPWATERRYAAAIRAWLRPMKEYVHQYLKNNQESILRGDSAALVRQDAIPGGSYRRLVKSLEGWHTTYIPPLNSEGKRDAPPIVFAGLGNIAESMNDFNGKQWEKAAKAELGVEFPVYEEWWPRTKQAWQDKNYTLIQSLSADYIKQVNAKAELAVTSGWSPKQLAQEILKLDKNIEGWRANLIARDQIGKLNGMVTQARMEAVGLELYEWSTGLDERVRKSHLELEGKICRWADPSVYSEDGGKTWKDRPADWCQLHPGYDIQCFPSDTKVISLFQDDRFYRRSFTGELIKIITGNGYFSATKNHPILTDRGWVSAESLNIGDRIANIFNEVVTADELKNDYMKPTMQQCFDFFSETFGSERVTGGRNDFHGDGTVNEQVDIVNIKRMLRRYVKPSLDKAFLQDIFSKAYHPGSCQGNLLFDFFGLFFAPRSLMSFFSKYFSFFNAGHTHTVKHTFRAVTGLISILNKTTVNRVSCYIILFAQLLRTGPSLKKLANLILWELSEIVRDHFVVNDNMSSGFHSFDQSSIIGKAEVFNDITNIPGLRIEFDTVLDKRIRIVESGHVYNLQNEKGWYIISPGNIIVKNCRCTALSYWAELVDEVDREIDLLAVSDDNIPNIEIEALAVVKAKATKTEGELMKQRREAQERRRREENAQKAKEAADQLFPGEKWKAVEDGIYLSPNRPVGEKSSYKDEKRDAQILRDLGSTVYLTPESRSDPQKKYDAIVNGLKFEFKTMRGASPITLKDHFLRSRGQAPNVFINLEDSPLTRRDIMNTLYGARNSGDYSQKNKFKGGRIILKIKGQKHLLYLNIDDLKV